MVGIDRLSEYYSEHFCENISLYFDSYFYSSLAVYNIIVRASWPSDNPTLNDGG